MLLRMMVDRLALHDLEKWALTSWAIWNARNNYYFERIQIHQKEFLNGALGFLHGTRNAWQLNSTTETLSFLLEAQVVSGQHWYFVF